MIAIIVVLIFIIWVGWLSWWIKSQKKVIECLVEKLSDLASEIKELKNRL